MEVVVVLMAARRARLEAVMALLINLNFGVAPLSIYRNQPVIDDPIPLMSRVESDCVGIRVTALLLRMR